MASRIDRCDSNAAKFMGQSVRTDCAILEIIHDSGFTLSNRRMPPSESLTKLNMDSCVVGCHSSSRAATGKIMTSVPLAPLIWPRFKVVVRNTLVPMFSSAFAAQLELGLDAYRLPPTIIARSISPRCAAFMEDMVSSPFDLGSSTPKYSDMFRSTS